MADGSLCLAAESLERIHETALRILAELGVRVDHAAMRERLAAAGCRLTADRVYIPAPVVADALRRVPPAFQLYGRSTGRCITVGSAERTYCINTGIMPSILDLESGRPRRSMLADVRATTRLLDAMENVDAVYVSLVDATDLPAHMVTVGDLAAVLANTTKPLIGPGLANGAEAEAVVAMARAVRGGDAGSARSHPPCAPFVCAVSPLAFPRGVVDALVTVAEAGLPLDLISGAAMGLTAPYTIAGTVALGHAEVLAMLVMAQLVAPGLPVLYQNTPSVADMRTLINATGGPETGLIRRMVVQLARRLGLPACAHGHSSSAAHDLQAGSEKTLNQFIIAGARPALLGGLGGMANVSLTSYESILLDNELFAAIRRALRGVCVDDDHLAYDVIAELVGGENVTGHAHTVKHLRSGEVWEPRLADRRGLLDSAAGASCVERARSEARRLLAGYTVEPLPAGVQQEIDAILAAHSARCA